MTVETADARLTRICKLFTEYALSIDGQRFEDWARLFTPRGAIVVGDQRFEGTEALETFAAGSPVGLHLTGVPSIEDADGELVVRSSFVFVRADGSGLLSGTYADRILDDGSDARFVERSVDIVAQQLGQTA